MPLPANFEHNLAAIGRMAEPVQAAYQDICAARGNSWTPYDDLIAAAVDRVLALCEDYPALARRQRYATTMCFIRFQIDSSIRLYACSLVEDREQFAAQIAGEEQIDSMLDKDGNQMRDRYLLDRLAPDSLWLPKLYSKASDFIHLSKSQMKIAHTWRSVWRKDWGAMALGKADQGVDEEDWADSAGSFLNCTELFLRVLQSCLAAEPSPG